MNLRNPKASIVLMLAFFFTGAALAGGPQFVQNSGQWPATVQHYVRVGNADIFFERDGLKFNVYHPEVLSHRHDADDKTLHHGPDGYGYAIRFLGASNSVKVVGNEPLPYYHNYILGNDPTKWANNVPVYSRIKYSDIYPGIDLVYREEQGKLKYDLIIDAGADASRFVMRYDGVRGLKITKEGNLEVVNPFNSITETAPVAYQTIGGKKVFVPCRFVLNGSEVSFGFPKGYDHGHELVIDPTLIFSSYSGSFSDNFGFTATYDSNGSLYGGGIVFGANYPFVTGSYSGSFSGVIDMGISKFSPNGGSLLYSTYIGGSGSEAPQSMVVNNLGQLVILGTCGSNNFPTTATAYDQTFGGGTSQSFPTNGTSFPNGTDIVVVVLSADGSSLVGSTYLGGTQNDGLNPVNGSLQYNYGDQFRGEVIVNAQNDIFIASSTRSGDFPATPGAFDTSLGGLQDAVVARFNPTLSTLTWATFLGGSAADAGYSLKLSPNGSLYVTGGTQSNNFPLGPGGLNTTAPGGATDGFLVRLTANGNNVLAGTYLGTSAYDQSYFVEIDADGDVYTYGQTLGSYPVTPGVFSNPNSKQFIHKLNASLSTTLFSTVFGSGSSNVNISPTAFLVDQCKRIYTSGWGGSVNNAQNSATGSTANMTVTPNAQQSTTDGSDFYFMVLETNATSLLYATYFGGNGVAEHVDGGTSRFNPQGQIYQAVCAGCGGSQNFPTTPGAWSNSNNASNCNLGVIKFDFEITAVNVSITTQGNVTGCAPLTVDFGLTQVNADQVLWDFGDGSPTTNQQAPVHTFTTPGTYVVTLTGTNNTNCPGVTLTDQATITITVGASLNVNAGPDASVCPGQGVQIGIVAQPGMSYSWSPSAGLSNSSISNPVASPNSSTTYTLTVSDALGCSGTDQVMVSLFPQPIANAGPDAQGCQGFGFQLNASGGASYSWSPSTGLSNSTIANPVATINQPITYTVTVTDANGCQASDQVFIDVFTVTASVSAPSVCIGGSVTLSANSGSSWLWAPPTGLSSATAQNPTASPALGTTTYTVLASNGLCQATDQVTVTVNPLPQASAGLDQSGCLGTGVQLNASGGQSYSWSPSTGLSSSTVQNPNANPGVGTTTYTVTVTDANGCQASDGVVVTIHPLPNVTTGPDSTLCLGGSMVLSAIGAQNYLWTPAIGLSDPNSASPTASPSTATTYTVTGTDGNGCQGSDSISLDFFTISAGPDTALCPAQPVQGFVTGGSSFAWLPTTGVSNPTVPNPTIQPTASTTYTVTATSAFGCVDTALVKIDVIQAPQALFTASFSPTCQGVIGRFDNQSQFAATNRWWLGDGTVTDTIEPVHTYPTGNGPTVTLVVTDASGLCTDTLTIDYSGQWLGSDTLNVVFGNVITPNNDGLNDCFAPGFAGDLSNCYELIVYNRWGGLIFESTAGSDHCWDGRTKAGKMVEDGTYYYIVKVVDVERAGWVFVTSH